jgi:predicted XRE-type DNA-binding protein
MKIRRVTFNNRKKGFEVKTASRTYWFPYAKLEVKPLPDDPIARVAVDADLGREGFTYSLRSGKEGTVHVDQVLEYNQDPAYLRQSLLYDLTLEAQRRVEQSPLSKREIIRRLGTSASQFYRLLDQTNYRKSIGQLISLLRILDYEVEVVVRPKSA